MKTTAKPLVIVAAALFIFTSPWSASASPNSGSLYVTLTLGIQGSRSAVVLTGTTNLPDGTLLMLDFAEKAWTELPANANAAGYYVAGARAWVHAGHFRSRTFTYRGYPFPPGSYRASVMTPYPGLQPASVKAVIGARGQNLRGPLVKRDLGMNLVEPPPVWITIR